MNARAIRLGFWLSVCTWLVWATYTHQDLTDMAVQFAAAGVIPGTSILLSPDLTILSLMVVVLGVVALFRWEELVADLHPSHFRLDRQGVRQAIRTPFRLALEWTRRTARQAAISLWHWSAGIWQRSARVANIAAQRSVRIANIAAHWLGVALVVAAGFARSMAIRGGQRLQELTHYVIYTVRLSRATAVRIDGRTVGPRQRGNLAALKGLLHDSTESFSAWATKTRNQLKV